MWVAYSENLKKKFSASLHSASVYFKHWLILNGNLHEALCGMRKFLLYGAPFVKKFNTLLFSEKNAIYSVFYLKISIYCAI